MKKRFAILSTLLTITAMAQTKGTFETHDFDNFRLHVYHTNDALGDASYIVEGTQAVVTLEQPLFRENVAEYDAYLDALGKPVEARIADYHVGGTGDHATVMPEGMPAFTKDAVYDGMMRNFAQTFGDAIVDRPTGATDEVAFGTTAVGGDSVPFRPRRRDRLSRREHPHRRQGLLHPLGSREGTREFPANLLAGSRRRRDRRGPSGARIGRRALHRRTRRSGRGRCRALQDRLSGMRETPAGRKRDGRRIRPCIASGLSGTPGRSGTGCIGAGALRRPITIPPP